MKGKKAAPKSEGKAVATASKKGGKSPFEVAAEPGDMKPEGTMGKRRIDRPGRRMGGRVGADSSPLSTGNKTVSRSC